MTRATLRERFIGLTADSATRLKLTASKAETLTREAAALREITLPDTVDAKAVVAAKRINWLLEFSDHATSTTLVVYVDDETGCVGEFCVPSIRHPGTSAPEVEYRLQFERERREGIATHASEPLPRWRYGVVCGMPAPPTIDASPCYTLPLRLSMADAEAIARASVAANEIELPAGFQVARVGTSDRVAWLVFFGAERDRHAVLVVIDDASGDVDRIWERGRTVFAKPVD